MYDDTHVCCHTITNICIYDSPCPPITCSSHVFNVIKNIPKPTFYHQAKGDHKWETVVAQELDALNHNCTWTALKLDKGKKTISCLWVYKLKYKVDG